MVTDLRDKLRQLGVTKGAKIKPQPRRAHSIESLLKGQEIDSLAGKAFVIDERYPLDHLHGDTMLGAFLEQRAAVAAQLAYDAALADVELSRCAFLDTETTGLSGGAGTLAFLVGLGVFQDATFCIRQFFLRDPDQEPALLAALSESMDDRQAIITFNGRGFDLPLLQTRYTLARMHPAWQALPHLDLLMPARRVWRDRLASRALSSLEVYILGVQRTQDDVPGHLIPQMYLDYLYTGDASNVPRVIYHNRQDILSMVTLAARLCSMFADPLANKALDPVELVSLAKWYEDLGMQALAERILHAALEREMHSTARASALARLGFVLKRQNRRQEAVTVWEQLAQADSYSVTAHVELAKYFEWHAGGLEQALAWTQAAQEVIATWPSGDFRDRIGEELAHRLDRLEHKLRAAS
jgi:uncharacterized protein YprB with RNaseH-like and TPR domain